MRGKGFEKALRKGSLRFENRHLCRHGMKRLFTAELVYRNMYTGIEMANELKPVRWIGTSLRDLRSSPRQVRIDIGQALFAAQEGMTDPAAKPLKGFGGASVLEIVVSHHGNAWRAVYTVRFQDAIYLLHAFRRIPRKGLPCRRGTSI